MVEPPLRQRLRETIAWCTPRASALDPLDSLRAPELRPRTLEASYTSAVQLVGIRREHALSRRSARSDGWALEHDAARAGRLLLYWPDRDLACGTAEAETRGYFDVHNCPPWDTWVAVRTIDGGAGVVCWVPQPLVALVDRGVQTNPEECIVWLDREALAADEPLWAP